MAKSPLGTKHGQKHGQKRKFRGKFSPLWFLSVKNSNCLMFLRLVSIDYRLRLSHGLVYIYILIKTT